MLLLNADMFQEQPEAVGGSSSPRGSNGGSPAAAATLGGVSSSTHRQRRSPSVPTAAVAPSPLHTEEPPTRVSNNVEQLFTRTRPASTTSVPGTTHLLNLPISLSQHVFSKVEPPAQRQPRLGHPPTPREVVVPSPYDPDRLS